MRGGVVSNNTKYVWTSLTNWHYCARYHIVRIEIQIKTTTGPHQLNTTLNMSFLKRIEPVSLVQQNRVFCVKSSYTFKTCLPASLIMHVSISELHAQWHWSLRFLQFHPTVLLVVFVNSCCIIIRQNFFPVSFSSRIS